MAFLPAYKFTNQRNDLTAMACPVSRPHLKTFTHLVTLITDLKLEMNCFSQSCCCIRSCLFLLCLPWIGHKIKDLNEGTNYQQIQLEIEPCLDVSKRRQVVAPTGLGIFRPTTVVMLNHIAFA